MKFVRPIIVVSKCLGFDSCRYNESIINDENITNLKKYVQFIPVCPELEMGLGVPRDSLSIIVKNGENKLYQNNQDLTLKLEKFSEKFLNSLKDVDAFIVANDGMAGGVISVLKEFDLAGKIPVTGLDAEARACKRILNDEQSMSVYMSIKELAYTSADLAMQVASGAKIDYELVGISNGRIDVPSIILDPIAVDKNNIESTVIAEGYLTMSEINASGE